MDRIGLPIVNGAALLTCVGLCLLYGSPASALETVDISPEVGVYSLGPQMSILQDASNTVTALGPRSEEHAARWRQTEDDIVNLGFVSVPCWFSVALRVR